MKLYESSEDYLETILILRNENPEVHSIDVARKLGFSKPSVSVALHKLVDNGYIYFDTDTHIQFTDKGLKAAQKVYERHLTISKLLISLGIDEKVALEDACKIEHDISEETFNALRKLVK